MEKLRRYLDEHYPNRKQQIYAHVMSMSARALIGVLVALGLFEEEVDQIIGERSRRHERIRKEKKPRAKWTDGGRDSDGEGK